MYDSVVFQSNEESISITQDTPFVRVLPADSGSVSIQASDAPGVTILNDEPKVVFVTTVDSVPGSGGGGPDLPPELKTVTLNFSLAAGSGVNLTATIKSVYSFVALTSTQPDIRIRAYNSVAARAADVSRSHTTMASTSLGLIFEGLTATGYLSMNWSPSPTGYTVDESDQVPVRIDNIASVSTSGSVTLYYYG